jgi:hypothetical protein
LSTTGSSGKAERSGSNKTSVSITHIDTTDAQIIPTP